MTYGFGFDPEVPAGYQDADIEMAEAAEAADNAAADAHFDDAYYGVDEDDKEDK